MKFCPTCETRYDEEILRFCTKDGTPLIDESQPNFVETSAATEAEEMDFGEETVIRLEKKSVPKPPPDPEIDRSEAPRIVIPMTDEGSEQRVRARNVPPYQPMPPKPNITKVVVMTVLGTVGVLAFGFALFYLLRSDDVPANTNLNVNTNPPNMNVNLNTNLNIGNYNFNINTNTSTNFNLALNLNTNVNANRTPKPSPTPSISPTPESNVNSQPNINTAPSPRPTVSATSAPPKPSATPTANPTVKPTSNNNH